MDFTQVNQVQIRQNLNTIILGSDIPTSKDILVSPVVTASPSVEVLLSPEASKFFIDEKMWMEDIDNPYREPDGVTGFNSILVIDN